MLDKLFLDLRVGAIHRYLDELAPLVECDLETYKKEYIRRYAAERLVEIIVEYATDVNRHILQTTNLLPAQAYYSTFVEIARLGIIPDDLAARLGASTGLRNRLAHQYETVRDDVVYRSLKPLVRTYTDYVTAIRDYLTKV